MKFIKLLFVRIAGNKLMAAVAIAFLAVVALGSFYKIFSPYENCLRDYTWSLYKLPPNVYCNKHTKW